MVSQNIVHVRKAKKSDLPKIHEIADHCFKDPYPLQLLKQIRDANPEGFLAAEKNGKIVGYLIGMVRWEDTGHILAIAVDKEHRKEGVGRALMEKIITLLEDNGASHIKREVRIGNEGAQKFYRKIGFKPKRVVPEYYSDKEDAVTMEYQL